jgi:maleate cis-trans isomerase
MAERTKVGLLYPGHAAEDDYPLMGKLLGPTVALRVVHTSVGEDAHRVDALLDLGSSSRLSEGADQLRRFDVDAVIWACTSGSFVFGWDGARQQVEVLTGALDVPASSTSFAFVHAAQALNLARVAVAATYPEDVAARFAEFLGHGGVEVVRLSSRGIITAVEVGTLKRTEVMDLAIANDHPAAEAVLLPDTAMHTISWLDDLENKLGKPVLTANQVSVWEGLRIAGHQEEHASLGALFHGGSSPEPSDLDDRRFRARWQEGHGT